MKNKDKLIHLLAVAVVGSRLIVSQFKSFNVVEIICFLCAVIVFRFVVVYKSKQEKENVLKSKNGSVTDPK